MELPKLSPNLAQNLKKSLEKNVDKDALTKLSTEARMPQKVTESVIEKLGGVTRMHALAGAAAAAALAAAYANRKSLSTVGSDVKKKATALWDRMRGKKEEESSSVNTPDASTKEPLMPEQKQKEPAKEGAPHQPVPQTDVDTRGFLEQHKKGVTQTAAGLTEVALLASLVGGGTKMKIVSDFLNKPIIPKSLLSKLPEERVFQAPSLSKKVLNKIRELDKTLGELASSDQELKKLIPSDEALKKLIPSDEALKKLIPSDEALKKLIPNQLQVLSDKILVLKKTKGLGNEAQGVLQKLSEEISKARADLETETFKKKRKFYVGNTLKDLQESVIAKLGGVTRMHALAGAAATAALAAAYANRQSLSSFGSDVKKKATALWDRMRGKKEEESSSADTPDEGTKEMPDQMTPGQLTSLADAD